MYVKQGDLFWGMSGDFVKEAMDSSEKISQEEGAVLFNAGDPADSFYVLLGGNVLLSLGDTGPKVYKASNKGEIIGWSSLIGRDTYSATAKCTVSTNLVKFESSKFLELLGKDPANEALLFKRLTEMLGNRLLDLYPTIA